MSVCIDHVLAKVLSGKKLLQLQISHFTGILGISEGKGIKRIAKTFPNQNKSPWNKYGMYFCLVTYR